MPQAQVVDFGESPFTQAFKGFGENFGKRIQQEQERDAVKGIIDKYKPGMSRTDFLRESLTSHGNLPLQKRAQIFEALDTLQKEESEKERQKKTASAMDERLAQAGATPAEILQYQKNLNQQLKTQQKQQQLQDASEAAQTLLSNPKFNEMSDTELYQAGLDQGLDPVNAKRIVDIRQKQKENSEAGFDNKLKVHNLSKDFRQKIAEDVETSKKRLHAFANMKKGLATKKVGPGNWRNVVASAPGIRGTAIGNWIETPENQEFRAQTYYAITGAKNDFGVRLSDADLRLVMDKVPSADKTEEANRRIIDFLETYDKMSIEKQKVADRILKENGGFAPIDFESRVREELSKSPLAQEFERGALDVMALDDDGKVMGVWMEDPESGERHLINKEDAKEAEKEFGFRRI
jgi:hypothetical protein